MDFQMIFQIESIIFLGNRSGEASCLGTLRVLRRLTKVGAGQGRFAAAIPTKEGSFALPQALPLDFPLPCYFGLSL